MKKTGFAARLEAMQKQQELLQQQRQNKNKELFLNHILRKPDTLFWLPGFLSLNNIIR